MAPKKLLDKRRRLVTRDPLSLPAIERYADRHPTPSQEWSEEPMTYRISHALALGLLVGVLLMGVCVALVWDDPRSTTAPSQEQP